MGSRLEKNSTNVRKRIESHTFGDEQGEEYQGSTFGGFSDYMRRKKIKLQNLDAELRSQSGDNPPIFRGIVAYVNGYTQPSLNDLHVMIVSHGGGFLQYLEGKTACTHIIASQLTPKKKAEFAKYRIVKPAWVVDSVQAGKLLPWDGYRVVDEGVTQKVLGFDNGQIISQVNKQRQSYRGQTDTSWYTSQVKGMLDSSCTSGEAGQILLPEGNQESNTSREEKLEQPELTGSAGTLEEQSDQNGTIDTHNSVHTDHLLSLTTTNDEVPRAHASIEPQVDIDPETKAVEKRKLTAEEHNAVLLQNPHMAKSSTANPDFLNQYYRESRLHHLSFWKAELKAQMQARALEKISSQKALNKKTPGAHRYIMHVDFDSFFAAVSLRKNPHLIEQPVVVAHGSGPGSEIASCNYPARKFGIKNGMWMKYALELCANLRVLPYDYDAYEEASRHFYDAILAMDGTVQSISIDEALIDVSVECIQAGGSDGKATSEGAVYREQSKANELAQLLRTSVKEKTGCDVSVGIGGNILLAKVALRKAKPAGQHQILPDNILDFVGELKVTELPGVAHSLEKKLEEIGVRLVKDIRTLSKERLVTSLGPKTGEKLWDYSRGIDKVEVGDQVVRKSVSAEINWGIRFVTQQQAEDFVQSLCDELQKRLLENMLKGKQLTMKIMRKAADAGLDPPKNLGHGKCDTFNKSVVLGVATNDKMIIGKEAISILRSYGFSPGELRGLGVQMQKLEPLKPTNVAATTLLEGSQRRLTFKKPENRTDVTALNTGQPDSHISSSTSHQVTVVDTIDEIKTPEKASRIFATPGTISEGSINREKPLNMLGTQFILPSQVDPAVLSELPRDVRSKLAPMQRNVFQGPEHSETDTHKSQSDSPYLSDAEYGLPSESQLDPETLAALPEDVREELMTHYRNSKSSKGAQYGQSLLPQSPRKSGTVPRKLMSTPTKKHKISTLFGKPRSKVRGSSSSSTLTQSNFSSMAQTGSKISNAINENGQMISQSFLDELPEDIRAELLADQRRNRMKARSGLNVGTVRKKVRVDPSVHDLPRGQQTLTLPAQPETPYFTSRKLRTLPELRDAMSAWVQEFTDEGEQGPFEEDTSALGLYLSRVVTEERDMLKAISVLQWLDYLIRDWPFVDGAIENAWVQTMRVLKTQVQEAVKARGLPPLELDFD